MASPMMQEDNDSDNSLYPIAVLIDELRNEDVQVRSCVFWQLFNEKIFIASSQ